jgi:peptidoglycan/LPS O-acetylase OafA/YrhL
LTFLGAFPLAYATVWVGMMRPPRIALGDLSYGVFLFHYPVEQSIVHMLPWVRSWTALTVLALPAVFCCAWLSWMLVERPILWRKTVIVDATLRGVGAALAVGRRPFEMLHPVRNRDAAPSSLARRPRSPVDPAVRPLAEWARIGN